jgi:hypothetical protein
MTEVISTEVIHAEADAVAGLGLLWGRLQSAMPWMTEVIPTQVIIPRPMLWLVWALWGRL